MYFFLRGLTHREPLVDEGDFERFVQTVAPLLQPGRDVMWALVGRTESNAPKMKKILRQYGLKFEHFYLCYNTKQMQQYGYWKRQRGIANSKSLEQALYVYKARVPKAMPKTRLYVDPGSPLFNQVVRNTPVLAPKHQALVSRQVRQVSLDSMIGVPNTEDDGEAEKQKQVEENDDNEQLHQPDGPDKEDKAIVAGQVKKRKLYRQHTGTDVPWFPHDNDMELLKEFCWEGGKPRWVFFGTPAGGAGIHGCLEAGCSVVALCYNDHHRTHLQKFLMQRAVEALVSGTTSVFTDQALQARSSQLKLTNVPKGSKEDHQLHQLAEGGASAGNDPAPQAGADEKKKSKSKGKDSKPKSKRASKKRSSSSGDESDTDPDDDAGELEEEPTRKKSKKP